MKKILPLLLFISASVNAQIVNIPDTNLKNALINYPHFVIDTNNNDEIEWSEAQAVTSIIDVSNRNISDMTGIEAFANITGLSCHNNNITTLNVSTMSNLQSLMCFFNNLTSLDLSGLANLNSVSCNNNPLTLLTLTGLANLQILLCDNSDLVSIDAVGLSNLLAVSSSNCPLLTSFSAIGSPMLSTINFSGCPQLQELSLPGNSLDMSFSEFYNCPNLQTIDFSNSSVLTSLILDQYPNLVSVDVSDSPMLDLLWVSGANNLADINLTGLPMLTSLSIAGGALTSVDLSDLTSMWLLVITSNENLESVDLSAMSNLLSAQLNDNKLSSVVFPDTPLLSAVYVNGNRFENLDLSGLPGLMELNCSDNPLVTLNIKNGIDETTFFFDNLTSLQHICADESQVDMLQGFIGPGVQVNSYCSFVPGGDYNTITGSLRYDADVNGCDASDAFIPTYTRINLTGSANAAAFLETDGTYHFYTGAGNFTVTPMLEHPEYFTVSPAFANADFATVDNSVQVRNFCMTATSQPDLEVIVTGLPPRAGFDANYKITYKNKGTTMQSGLIDCTFDDARTDFVTATPAPDSQSANHLFWNFANLNPFETRSIIFTLHTNAPTDVPALNVGDVLTLAASISSGQTETTPADNISTLSQTVVNSYDPNHKICVEGDLVNAAMIGQYLHYNIHFENVGTAEAVNVVVKDLIDATRFDLSTLQIVSASHPMRALMTGDKIEFIFQNINLPPSSASPIGGHGNVLFKIRTLPTLQVGDMVANTAHIYFDYNHPILTNEARTTFAVLNRQVFTADNSISVYPNPVKNTVLVKAGSAIQSLSLFDVQGRLLETRSGNVTSIDLSGKPKGLYFLKVTTTNGAKIEKIVKE